MARTISPSIEHGNTKLVSFVQAYAYELTFLTEEVVWAKLKTKHTDIPKK